MRTTAQKNQPDPVDGGNGCSDRDVLLGGACTNGGGSPEFDFKVKEFAKMLLIRGASSTVGHFKEDALACSIHLLKASDSSRVLKEFAVHAIGAAKDPHGVPALIDVVMNADEDTGVRGDAVWVLRRLAGQSAAPVFIEMLGDAAIGDLAAYAIGELRDACAVPALIEVLGHERAAIRERAAESLGKIGAAEAKPPLHARLASETNDAVRQKIESALQKLEDLSDRMS